MATQEQLRQVIGTEAYDRDGDKLGRIGQVYHDDDTNEPKWITVNTGLFGMHESFVPLRDAQISSDRVVVAYDKATVKDAPRIGDDRHLSVEEEQRLYRHYSLDYGAGHTLTGNGEGGGRDLRGHTEGYDTSGPTTDTAMTRSEEHLRAGTQTQEVGRARLRKYVVTEHEQVTVPVSHEEVRIEREPITAANRGSALDGPAISEEEHEVTLHAERPVVATEAQPVERVRLGTETVREEETVGGEVRREEIEVDDPTGRGTAR